MTFAFLVSMMLRYRSLPYLIRLRQCLIEYNSPTNTTRRPLFNAIKYASSFPVIFLSAAQRIVISDLLQTHGSSVTQQGWHGEHPLFRLWYVGPRPSLHYLTYLMHDQVDVSRHQFVVFVLVGLDQRLGT